MAAKIDIAQSIRDVLDDDGKVHLHGLGTLHLVHHPARFGELRRTLLPPFVTLVLEDDPYDNEALVNVLQRDYGLSPEKAQKAIRKYSQSILNALLNYRKVYLTGIGVITRNGDGEVYLIPDEKFTGRYSKHLPEIKVTLAPVKKQKEKTELPPIEALASPASPESKLFDQPAKESADKDSDMRPPAPVSIPKKTTEVDDESEVAEQEDKKKAFNWWLPLIVILIAIIAAILVFRSCNKQDVPPADAEPTERQKMAETLFDGEVPGPDSLSAQSVGSLPDSCIIITGSFASQENVSRMKSLLTEKNYSIYSESYGPYTRVGLTFACENVDLENYIQEIRRQIAPQAWYLDPELYVAY